MCRFFSLFFSGFTVLVAYQLQAQVVLSEIMFDAAGNEAHDEFVEIRNLSLSESVNLIDWQLSDGSASDIILGHKSGVVLGPGQFAVILDASYFDNSTTYDALIPDEALVLTIDNATFGSAGLSNSVPETVSLLNAEGIVVSAYTYSLGNAPGFSDEKIDAHGSDAPSNWADSVVLLGTPGFINSVAPPSFDLVLLQEKIRFSPEEIVEGDAVLITATVHNVGLEAASAFTVTFFEDTDQNDVGEPQEQLGQGFQSQSLSPGDSADFSLEYGNLLPGLRQILVEVDFPDDQNLNNNHAVAQLAVGFAVNTLRINEIMYSPFASEPEWVELFNPGSNPVNLQKWSISDSDTADRALIDSSLIVPPGGLFVLAGSQGLGDIFDLDLAASAVIPGFPGLNNDSDSIVLSDPALRVIDRVNYASTWGGGPGLSLEKINPGLDSNDSNNWSSSVAVAGGTPGRANSILAETLPQETLLAVEPNPFSPDADGVKDFALISYELPVSTAIVNMKIYDIRGRLIRFLANNRSSGSQNTIVWDGKDDNGEAARMGLYIVFVQALNAQAGILATGKKTVVLAKRL